MAEAKVKVKAAWGKKETKSTIKIKAKTLGGALKELCKLDEFDTSTGHGSKKGVELSIARECE